MKTISKKNHLPCMSAVPFCLMVASIASYPLDTLATEHKIELDSGSGKVYFDQPDDGGSNTLIIKGSISKESQGWAIWAGQSLTINASGNSVISDWGSQKVEIKKGIFGGYLTNAENSLSVSDNEIILDKKGSPGVEVSGDIKAALAEGEGGHKAEINKVDLSGITVSGGGVYGAHIIVGNGDATSNSVKLNESKVSGVVIGVLHQGSGDLKENTVELSKTTVDGSYVVGGSLSGLGDVTYSTVTISDSELAGYVNGGLIDGQGQGSTLYNSVKVKDSTIEGYVYGGNVNSQIAGGTASENKVILENSTVKGVGVVGGYYLGTGSSEEGQVSPGSNSNTVEVTISNGKYSNINSFVVGGLVGAVGKDVSDRLQWDANGNKVSLSSTSGHLNVNGYVAGGFNQGAVRANSNSNEVSVEASSSDAKISISEYVLGGYIWGRDDGSTNNNLVDIKATNGGSVFIDGYVGGGSSSAEGQTSASENKVFINGSSDEKRVEIGSYVFGGLLGAKQDSNGNSIPVGPGNTDGNVVEITNAKVKQYIAGGYNESSQGDAKKNVIKLDHVSLKDEKINSRFVVGGLIGEGNKGNADENEVYISNSQIKVKYLAGGVSQGNGTVNKNKVVLENTGVEGLVVGGLDWGNKKVNLSGNNVSITGGSVRKVDEVDDPDLGLTGRVIGARSFGSGDVSFNTVQLQDVEVEGAVRGGVSAGGGNSLNNKVVIQQQSLIKQSVAGGYIEEHQQGEKGDTLNNSVVIMNSSVEDNVEGGFNQIWGMGNASRNTVQIGGDGSFVSKIDGFVNGGSIGRKSEGNTNENQVKILAQENASIEIGGYVTGGYNDGTGGGADENAVWLESTSPKTSKLTVGKFVVGGYLRSGEGSTNENTVVIKNAVVSGPYIVAGLNEGLGQAQSNSVILESVEIAGGVTGGRVTASALTSSVSRFDAVNPIAEESAENYSALVQNNIVKISGETSVVGRIFGGESLAGNSVKERPAYIQNNTVVIDDGYVDGEISGGVAVAGNVIGNEVFLNGGTIKGLVYGGRSAGEVKDNIVYLDGRKGIDVTGAWIFGRGRASTGTNGNTLNITNFKGAMQNIGNFDRIDLDLAGLMVREKEPIILLTDNQSTNLDNSTIHIHTSGKAIAVTDDSPLADRYEVIKNQSGSLTAFNVIYEKDKLVVAHERGTMEGLYRVEWDGSPDQIGDSIDLVLERVKERPESGTYISNSLAWSRMHMRLHDRFGQAYYIDPFSGEERAAAGWVRQVGSHSHFRAGSDIKTHSRTAVTQIGADLIRNEVNQDVKSVWGIFAGGLYNRSSAKTHSSAQSRSDGYALGVYGTLYTGNSPDDGFYVDSWLLFGHYNNKLWTDDLANFRYKSNGWVWSVESGYTIPLSESGSKDFNKVIWTLQPEIQLVWDGVKADTTVDKDTETRFKQLGTNNVSLRIGARLHANHMNKGLGFIEGNWIHNTKRAGVQMGTGCKYIKGGRNLAEFRAGFEGHVTKNLLGWATVGVQAGQHASHNETAQIGLKYMF